MILVYAYIGKYRNFSNTEICLDSSYKVSYQNGELFIEYNPQSEGKKLLGKDRISHLHMLVGKTGSGKTNLLQLIGADYEKKSNQMWNLADESYFLLYSVTDTEFYLEICDVKIKQFPYKEKDYSDYDLPSNTLKNAKKMDKLRTVRFKRECIINCVSKTPAV